MSKAFVVEFKLKKKSAQKVIAKYRVNCSIKKRLGQKKFSRGRKNFTLNSYSEKKGKASNSQVKNYREQDLVLK